MNEREIIECDKQGLFLLLDVLDIKDRNWCFYCHKRITHKNIGGIFNNPVRTICDSIICLTQIVNSESGGQNETVQSL